MTAANSVGNAIKRVDVAFEFITKLGVPFYCFHDRDVAPEGATLSGDRTSNLDEVATKLKEKQQETGIKLLWGTANLFSNPRLHARRGDQLQRRRVRLRRGSGEEGDRSHARAGRRELRLLGRPRGVHNLFNTDMKRELDHLAKFMHMAHDHAKSIGFKGQFLFEPKPKEPTKHQYDFDAAACLNFIGRNGLDGIVKLNIETNHATLAGHTMMHELEYARIHNALGSIDANTGDLLLGWDTDQFPTDIYLTTQMHAGDPEAEGLGTGGVNFDAKVRRESFEPIDLFHAHIGGMDAFARGAKIAAAIRKDGILDDFVKDRYRSFDTGIGKKIEDGNATFADCEKYMLDKGEVSPMKSGRQE